MAQNNETLIAAVEAALTASTPGEWYGCHDGNCVCGTISSYEHDFMIARTELNHFEDAPQNVPMEVYTANAKFIFLAHNTLPAILERLRALEAENARLLETVDTIYALLQTLPIGGTYTAAQHVTVGKAYDIARQTFATVSRPIAASEGNNDVTDNHR